jgi:hypothetical protein
MAAKSGPSRGGAVKKSTTKKAAKASSSGRRQAAASAESSRAQAQYPDRIYAIASPRSVGGVSLFEPGVLVTSDIVGNFVSDEAATERAVGLLADAGFEILQVTAFTINIAGSKEQYEAAFGTTIVAEERPTMKQQGIVEDATYFDTTDTDVPGLIDPSGSRFGEVLEGIAIEEPAYLAAPATFPPPVDYWHLDVPADVSLGCSADKAHRGGTTGSGVTVAMVDTGWQSHPFFTDRGYRVDPTVLGPGTADPTIDENGHGTGESANIFATAPDVLLKPVKTATASGALVNVTAAFNAGVALGPDIISNSWTSSIQFGPLSAAMQAREAAVAAAWASGIVVVFAAGNGHWGFPGQHPDVISAGGVDLARDGSLRASDYASGFMSNIYPGRRVPDLSGLVGMQPGAQSIMLPVPEGCQMDNSLSGGTHPNGDETPNNDGWAAFSGTSAACPQIAGVCALIKQACPRLAPAEVREILMTTARDVTTGTNHSNFGNTAVVGPDTATGNGLVDAHRAVLIAKLRCVVVPIIPIIPFRPVFPVRPFQPIFPIQPVFPFRPIQPVFPIQPFRPVFPIRPVLPLEPFAPFGPGPGADPGPFAPEQREGQQLSAEDLANLEQMIIESPEPPVF